MARYMEVLERKPVEVKLVDVSEAFADKMVRELYEESQKLLGYSVPKEQERMTREREQELQATLTKLEIEPFTADSVKKYKSRAARRANLGLGLVFVIALIGGVLGIRWLNSSATTSFQTPLPLWMWFVLGIGAVGIACWITGIVALCVGKYKWQRTLLSSYGGSVPEFALARALEIKNELPSARFEVEYLSKTELINPNACPFLIVGSRGAGVEYYIEVWGEPRFEREQKI